jgi:hypothetical protein
MPPSYAVRADVVDIRQDSPVVHDKFLVDTNVWYWQTYSRASQGNRPPKPYQVTEYPRYLKKALCASSSLNRCELSLAELAYLIETTEFDIFSKAGGRPMIGKKTFRHDFPAERCSTISEVKSVWGQVQHMASPIGILVDQPLADVALARCDSQQVDVYDSFLLEAMDAAGIGQVITDDGDFCTVPGITVFTANRTTISAAVAHEKLVAR